MYDNFITVDEILTPNALSERLLPGIFINRFQNYLLSDHCRYILMLLMLCIYVEYTLWFAVLMVSFN